MYCTCCYVRVLPNKQVHNRVLSIGSQQCPSLGSKTFTMTVKAIKPDVQQSLLAIEKAFGMFRHQETRV